MLSYIFIKVSKSLLKLIGFAYEKFLFPARASIYGKVQRTRNIPSYIKGKEDFLVELYLKGKVQRTRNIPFYVNRKLDFLLDI